MDWKKILRTILLPAAIILIIPTASFILCERFFSTQNIGLLLLEGVFFITPLVSSYLSYPAAVDLIDRFIDKKKTREIVKVLITGFLLAIFILLVFVIPILVIIRPTVPCQGYSCLKICTVKYIINDLMLKFQIVYFILGWVMLLVSLLFSTKIKTKVIFCAKSLIIAGVIGGFFVLILQVLLSNTWSYYVDFVCP